MSIEPVLVALLGLVSGIFINYLADVLPYTRRLSKPKCRECGVPIPPQNYLTGKGCSNCPKRYPIRFWIVNLISVSAALWLFLIPNHRFNFSVGFLLLVYLGVVALIDIETRLILNPVSMVGIILCLGIGTWMHGIAPTLIGGVAGFLIMLALYYFGDWFARTLAKARGQNLDEVALGFGDVTLSAILGLLLGWPGITAGLFAAILLGGLGSLIVIGAQVVTRRYQPFTAIPYAPFLILGTVILLYR